MITINIRENNEITTINVGPKSPIRVHSNSDIFHSPHELFLAGILSCVMHKFLTICNVYHWNYSYFSESYISSEDHKINIFIVKPLDFSFEKLETFIIDELSSCYISKYLTNKINIYIVSSDLSIDTFKLKKTSGCCS